MRAQSQSHWAGSAYKIIGDQAIKPLAGADATDRAAAMMSLTWRTVASKGGAVPHSNAQLRTLIGLFDQLHGLLELLGRQLQVGCGLCKQIGVATIAVGQASKNSPGSAAVNAARCSALFSTSGRDDQQIDNGAGGLTAVEQQVGAAGQQL
jgi:hypothetical protein